MELGQKKLAVCSELVSVQRAPCSAMEGLSSVGTVRHAPSLIRALLASIALCYIVPTMSTHNASKLS